MKTVQHIKKVRGSLFGLFETCKELRGFLTGFEFSFFLLFFFGLVFELIIDRTLDSEQKSRHCQILNKKDKSITEKTKVLLLTAN